MEKLVSMEESGDCMDWLTNSIFLINLNAKSAPSGQKVSLILNAITNRNLKAKAIADFGKLAEEEQTLEKLKDIIGKHTVKDQLTYRKLLKGLKYDGNIPMLELYSKIYHLIYHSMGLNPKTDENSINKLTAQWFLEKIPKQIVQQMQDASFDEGESLAIKAEKIRSFQKIFLSDMAEANHLKTEKPRTKTKR